MNLRNIISLLLCLLLQVCVHQTVIASQLPFQEKKYELDLYNHFGLQVSLPGNWIEELNERLAQFNYLSTFEKSDDNFLFAAYPHLQEKIPYLALGTFPTPIQKLHHLSNKYGVQIYMKNDALSGGVDQDGAPMYGGNKVRKLGFLLAHAKSLGATKAMFPGCVASNYAVAGAVHSHRLGMQPIVMLKHQPPSRVVQHNLLMHMHCGSEMHYSPDNKIRALNALNVWLDHYKKDGHVPYITPTGGSNARGTLGFVDAAFELAAQIKQGLMPNPDYIYVAAGNVSGATAAGLLLGCKAAGIKTRIVAIAVEPDEDPTCAQNIDRLFKEANQLLHENDHSFPLLTYNENDLRIDLNFTGPDYGIFTAEGVAAAQEINELEGVKLEGTYTAKALAGLLSDLKNKPDAVVVFWNTYSGLDFNKQLRNRDYKNLPKCFHDYFDDNNLQPLAC